MPRGSLHDCSLNLPPIPVCPDWAVRRCPLQAKALNVTTDIQLLLQACPSNECSWGSMQREIVCNILALAAPDSMLKGYAQCWIDLVQAMQPGQESQEAASLARLIKQHSCCPRLSFHVGAAAAPILSQGVLGMPSKELAGRVLCTYMRTEFKRHKYEGIISLLTGMLSAAPGATMAVVSLTGPRFCGSLDSTAADDNDLLVCRRSRMILEKRSD